MIKPSAPNRLIVEGKDDLHSVVHILRRHGIDYDQHTLRMPYINSAEGYENVLGSLDVSVKNYKRLGILVDADLSPQSRWTSLTSKLSSAGVPVPAAPRENGTIFPGFLPDSKVGIWLMPNNVDPGMLETFLGFLIPAGDRCFEYSGEVCQEAKNRGAPFSPIHLDKARMHTWLAWQENPGQPFGTAITASCFQTDTPLASSFVQWYKDLFLD